MRREPVLFAIALLAVACGPKREPKDPFIDDSVNSLTVDPDMGPTTSDMTAPILGFDDIFPCVETGSCELTCEVLARPDFCWNIGVTQAYACTEDFSAGSVSADGLTCADGDVTIEFGAAVISGMVVENDITDVRVVRDNAQCARVQETTGGFELTTDAGMTSIVVGELTDPYQVTCADGGVWIMANASDIFDCVDADGITQAPGTTTFEAGTEFGYGLLPRGENMFVCEF